MLTFILTTVLSIIGMIIGTTIVDAFTVRDEPPAQ